MSTQSTHTHTRIRRSRSIREIDWGYWMRHYADLFWRKKWYIATVGPLVFAAWLLYSFKFDAPNPDLEAEVIIGFDRPGEVGAVQNVGSTVNGKIELLQSRSFLRGVVERLGLRLRVTNRPRFEVFDSVQVAQDAVEGAYEMLPNANGSGKYAIHVTNEHLSYTRKQVQSGSLGDLDTLRFSGIHVSFSEQYLQAPSGVTFRIVSMQDAVDDLARRVTIHRETIRQGFVKVSLTGVDYELIARTVNEMADAFIARTLNMRKRKTTEVIDVLEKQLETATAQLARSEQIMRGFREKHPTVGLSQTASMSVENAMNLETASVQDGMTVGDAENLRRQFRNAADHERQLVIGEMLSFLGAHGVPAAASMRIEYNQIVARLMELRTNYAQRHPIVQEQHEKLSRIGRRADEALEDFIARVTDRIERHEEKISELTGKLRSLPRKELRLAKLERQRQVASEIHAMVQSRYNQAKIANAVEVPDMYVMDYAMAPIPPPDSVRILLRVLMGVLLGLTASFGPVLTADMIDKTARTQHEFMRLADIPVLETVPVIETRNAKAVTGFNDGGGGDRGIDEKLTTADYAPHYINEIYRSLRTKLLLSMHEIGAKGLVVTSLDMDEGKSLTAANVAITMAQRHLKTVLVDADLRRGVQHSTFGINKGRGLTDLLTPGAGHCAADIMSVAHATHVPGLTLMSTGASAPNPLELLSSPEFASVITTLRESFDIVIFDTPPLGVASDAVVLMQHQEKCLFVVRAGKTNTIDVRRKLEEYPVLHEKIIGAVLNRAPVDRRLRYYKYSNYNY